MQIRIKGGSSETDENALTVIPASRLSSAFVVTTVTPLANRLIALRNSSLLTGIVLLRLVIGHWSPVTGMDSRCSRQSLLMTGDQ
jgi:hypothetical protein